MDAEGRTELLRLQEPHQGRHEEQVDTDAEGDARLGARLAADGHAAHGLGQGPAIIHTYEQTLKKMNKRLVI